MNKRVVGAICAISTLFALNQSASVFADNSFTLSIDVSEAALQLTVPPTANIELNPTSSSAVFGSTNVTLNVATNNITGYRIVMSVPNTNLVHDSLSNTVIPTLSAASLESNFPANAWGYKVAGDNYQPVLTSNVPTSWIIEEPTNGTDHTMTLAAKVDGTKPSGTYTDTLTFQVVANPNSPKLAIVFDGNGADSGTMDALSLYPGDTASLPANAFEKTGYFFNGWNEKANAGSIGYGSEDSITAPDVITTPVTKTLYAQWVQDTGQGSGSVGKTIQDAYEMAYVRNPGLFPDGGGTKHGLYVPHKDPNTGEYDGTYFEATQASDYEGIPANDLRFAIQDIALTIDGVKVCDYATVVGSTAYVLDLRDFTSYHIIKAPNGRCWMTDNLALDPLDPGVVLNETNTNATTAAITNFLNGSETALQSGWSTAAVSKSWSNTYTQPRINVSSKNTIPQGDSDNLKDQALAGGWKVGVYYNYCAASIGTYCYGDGSGVDTPNTALDTEYDICPFGWRMPTGNTYNPPYRPDGGEIQSLDRYGLSNSGYNNFRTVFRLPLSGSYYDNKVVNRGNSYEMYSSTYQSKNTSYIFSASTNYFSPPFNTQTYTYRYRGNSVRCINKL